MFRVTDKPINLQELVDCVTDPEAGAIATFIGTTRNNNEGRKVIALDYEAYPEMAEKELTRLGEEARRKWQICRMAIVHRVGPGADYGAERNDRRFSGSSRGRICRLQIRHRGNQENGADLEKEVYEGGEIWIGTQSGQPLNRS